MLIKEKRGDLIGRSNVNRMMKYRTGMKSSDLIIEAIRAVPYGRVASYAEIADRAGIPGGARLVAWILHSCSEKYTLPWWRIVRSNGEIAISDETGRMAQKELLLKEGVSFRSEWKVEKSALLRRDMIDDNRGENNE